MAPNNYDSRPGSAKRYFAHFLFMEHILFSTDTNGRNLSADIAFYTSVNNCHFNIHRFIEDNGNSFVLITTSCL